ncbi:alpha/beta fold hydrolase [Denitromonas halophila]|uniref:Alpha/beta fold hydrolase n=2 Tax=Denitromonas halophila TaxID=1629404 RepID=A0A557QHE8_9RHOO|nr:alpha/beta fold hydrolase [Denitromonas halophila]
MNTRRRTDAGANHKLAPVQVADQALRQLHVQWESMVDPMGVFAPLVHAQLGWWSHPQELAESMVGFSGHLWALQWHSLRRMIGAPSVDPVRPHEGDTRFDDPVWHDSATWDLVKSWYLMTTRHTQDMLYSTPGLSNAERRRAAFWWRNWLNAVAPTNFLMTNPVALRKAAETLGGSLHAGYRNFVDDMQAGMVRMSDPDGFKVGGNLATTPGEVVFRNALVEVIHYAPTRARVRARPVVIITPWINKFYILDLNERKSMVRYLLDQGLDVYITSWKNPGADQREVSFDDYIVDGVHATIEAARTQSGQATVHAVGYCIGGTALSTYMAWANRRFGADAMPVADWTLLTTLVDFRKPGDIEVFVDEASVNFITTGMARKGYLDGGQMASAFRLLRSNSLIWHFAVQSWLYGEKLPAFDVLFWNMDTTRMPYRMHAWYLRELYLHNRLIEPNALTVAGEPIDLNQIAQPLYVVSAEDDHIAPWQQTFRIIHFVTAEKRFVLSSSGHILGIVNPPAKPAKRRYWAETAHRADRWEAWRERATSTDGSWWEDWMRWLKPRSGALVRARPAVDAEHPSLAPAPGVYVHEH